MDAVIRNLEVDYMVDMIMHNGFEITKPNKYSEVNINIDALVNSPRFMDTEYTCDCGAFIGRDILGQECPCCHSEIRLRSLNFEYTGWINIGNHKVITPTYYKKLTRVLGKNMLKFILGDYKEDKSVKYNDNDTAFEERKNRKKRGKQAVNDINTIRKKIAKIRHCYEGIGHDAFYRHFEEIMRNCSLSQHQEEMETLIEEKESIFTSKIPVYSTAFRPVVKTSEDLKYPKVNKFFSSICSIQTRLPDMILDVEITQALNDIQAKWIEAADYAIKMEMSKKKGSIRSEIVGGTFSFSARAVVTLNYMLRDDEITIPFSMAMIAYQFKIAHRLAVEHHMTLEQAYLFVSNYPRNEYVLKILNDIIAEGQWCVLIREPAINLGSIELCKIAYVKDDVEDTTISLPIEPLKGWNADFDGDQLDAFFIPPEAVHLFKAFHHSGSTDYVNEKIEFDLREWCWIPLGRISK